ncbi:MAG: fibronectin I domain-containing [Geobacteraceae bacterium]|nr:MAG: fibronectin I domain-containing [Geobacteraceae bacterium]
MSQYCKFYLRRLTGASRCSHLPRSQCSLFLLTLITILACAVAAFAKGGDPVGSFPSVDARAGLQYSKAMAVDAAGNIIVVGYTGTNGNDYQVVKFKADGSGTAWAPVSFGGSGADVATAVAVDSADNIIVTGYTWNGADYDIHTIKYSGADGSVLWEHTFDDGAANGNDYATAIAVDDANDIYVAGYSANGTKQDDFLVIKYLPSGPTANAPAWQELYDDVAYPNNNNRILAIAAGVGGIAVTGYSSKGGADFDILTRKYGFDKSLVREWRYSSPGSRDDRGIAVKTDSAGNVIVTGFLTNASNNSDICTAKYDPASDTPVWEKFYDGNGNDEPKGLWVDSAGNVYVTGYTSTLAGNQDIYTVRYSSTPGPLVWEAIFDSGNGSTDIPAAIVVDDAADGGVFVTGYTTISNNEDFLTLKYKKDNGVLLWEKSWNGSDNNNDRPVGIGLSSRNVCVAGWSDADATGYDFQAMKYDFGALNAPSNLTASAASNTSITLTWADNSTNEDKFVIQRKLGENGIFADITTVPPLLSPDTTTYTDTGLTSNSYYYYRIRAYNATNNDSYNSNEAHALTKVVSYDAPSWNYLYNSADNREDIATAITVGSDNHPVVTGYSDLTEEGVEGAYSFDYMTIKLDLSDKSIKWKARYDSGDGGTDQAAGVVLDSNSDVLVTGTAYLSGGTDKSDDLYTIKFQTSTHTDPNTNPPFMWDHQYGTQAGIDIATTITMAKDGSNNSVVIGYGRNASNNDDTFIIKYNQNGTRPWAPMVYDSGSHDHPTAVVFDAAGNIFVTGYSYATTADPAGSYDWFTAKYNGATGALIWSDTFNSGYGDEKPLSLDVDTAGNAYVTGYATNAQGEYVFYTVKYDGATVPAGNRRIWEKSFNYPGFDAEAAVVKVDPIDGAVVVAGTAYVSATDSDFHLIRYNPADGTLTAGGGKPFWEINFDRPATYDYVTAMTMDSSGYIYVTGNTRGGPDTDPAFDGTSDIMSLIYDYEGTFLGAMTYDGTGRKDETKAITVNYQGEAFVAGYSRNATNADYVVLKQTNGYLLVPAPFTGSSQADYSKVDLSWQHNNASATFIIERTPGPATPVSTWTVIATPGAGATSHTDTLLTADTNYCYRINAILSSLPSRKTPPTCVTTRLPKPTLTTLTVDSTSQITVNWDQVTGNTGYKVERIIGAGAWADLATKAAGENSHVDQGLTPGTTYSYRVSTNSAAGYSLPGNEPSAITKPVAPTLNAPTSITNTQMVLGWNAVTGAATYTLQYKLSGGVYANFPACTNIAGTTCTVTGLTAPNAYNFQVKAANAGGDSAWSNEQSGTAALAVPTLTTPIAVATITSTQMYVAWTNPVVSGANVTSYTLEYKEGVGGSYVASGCPANTNLFCTVTGLTPNRTYYFHVRANNASGSSNWSTEVNAKTLLPTPTLNSVTGGALKVDLVWTGVAEATGYTVQQSACTDSTSPTTCRGGAAYAAWGNIATGVTSPYSATGLAAGTNYKYQIIATVAGNSSAASNVLHAWTNLAAPTLTVTPASSTALTPGWDAQPGETNYTVEVSTTGIGGTYTAIPAATGLATNVITYPHTGLTLNTQYCYQVKAYSTEATPPPAVYSTPQCKTTPPVEPTLNEPTVASTTQINLSWSQVASNTGYEIERCITTDNNQPLTHPLGACMNLAPTVAQDTTSFNNTGLTAGNTYRYRVRALYNASADYTAWSNAYWVTTTPPAPTMTAPTAASTTTTQLTPTWNDVNGDNGYKLYWKARSGADCTAGTWNGPITQAINVITYDHAGRTPGTFYCYYITANGPSGPPVTPDSAASNVVSQTTKPSAPAQPTLSSITASSITVTWSPNVTGNIGYNIERKTGAGGTWGSVGTVGTDVTTLTNNTGLSPGTLYYYRVSANSAGGYSATSAEQSATTTPAIPSITATAVSDDEIDVCWPLVYGATSYKVDRKTESGGTYGQIANPSESYSTSYCGEPYPTVSCPTATPVVYCYQDTGLTENTTYYYHLHSANGTDSPESNEKSATTLSIPNQNLTATAVNSFKVKLDWTPIVCVPNPCDNPDSFEIERQVRDGNWVSLKTVDGGTLTFTDSISIDPNKQYSYRVRSVKGADKSPYSNTATVSADVYQTGDGTCN